MKPKGRCHLHFSSYRTLHYIKLEDNHHCLKRILDYAQYLPSNMHERTMFVPTQSGGATAPPECAALS